MKIEKMKVSDLKYAPYNPRKIDDKELAKLKRSISEFGYVEPIVWNQRTGFVVGGNQRLKALRELGIEEVDVVVVDLSDAKEKALNVALNKISGEWDFPKLKDLLTDIDTGDFDIELTGFDLDEIENLITFYKEPEEDGFDTDTALEEIEEPKTKRGDIYLLGKHRLMCGDSTVKEDVEKLMDGKKADMVFTDPPYGIDLDTDFISIHKGHTTGKKHNKIEGDKERWNFQKSDWFNCKEQFWWGADYYLDNLREGSWFVWDKTCGEFIGRIGNEFELCWSKQKHKREIIREKWVGYNNLDTKKREHPTQKPVKLCKWFIEKFSKRGQNIIDLFGGSGSTLIACEQLSRICYMIEIDERYCDVIVKRWEEFTGKKAQLMRK